MLLYWIFLFSGVILLLNPANAYQYRTEYIEMPVDHFNFASNETFKLRYLINDTYWEEGNKSGPIFLYTGNEGEIEVFADNTGFIFEIAPRFKALIVFAEHRYYGLSMPYGSDSLKPSKLGYLSTQQALADYVDLITKLKTRGTGKPRDNGVIAFGGSYGGMLAAYIRMKYPHVVKGSIAASAPIWQFLVPCETFNRILTGIYFSEAAACVDTIKASWHAADNVAATRFYVEKEKSNMVAMSILISFFSDKSADGPEWLQKEWNLCQSVSKKNLPQLKSWLGDMYTNVAMANYPYPTSFLGDLPGFPVKKMCSDIIKKRDPHIPADANKDVLSALQGAIQLSFNYTGKTASCFNFTNPDSDGLGFDAWEYQTCTEMVMPFCSNGVTDMFEPSPWNLEQFDRTCWNKYQVHPQADLAVKEYGGKNIIYASNIIFSNGLLDPWSGGGVLRVLSKNLVSILLPKGAHHLDLRASNPLDPPEIKMARRVYGETISKWLLQ